MERLVARTTRHVYLNSSPIISVPAVAFLGVMAFAVAAALIASFRVAFPAPFVVSGQASAAAPFSLIKLRQLMEPAQTHFSEGENGRSSASLNYLTYSAAGGKK